MSDTTGIPPAAQATTIPPPTGIVPRFLTMLFGASWRTSTVGWVSGLTQIAAAILSYPGLNVGNPKLLVALRVLAAIGTIKALMSAKDKSVTGVEK